MPGNSSDTSVYLPISNKQWTYDGQPYTPTTLEQLWLDMFAGRSPVLVLGVFAFVVHEIFYFGRYLPFWIADYIPALRKYKIQSNKENTNDMLWKCFKMLMFSHFLIQLPMMLAFHPVAEMFGLRVIDIFPTWRSFIGQIILFFVFEDFYHYWMHRIMHYPPFYKRVHKLHHEFSAPFGMAAEYAHPIETLVLGFGTVGGPLIWVMLTGDLHMVTMLCWVILRMLQAVEAHSGYDFPWSLHNWMPGWSGAEHHDYHHQAFINNFSSSFRWWDAWFGTDQKYKTHRAKQRREAQSRKAA